MVRHLFSCFLFLFAFSIDTNAQIITTIAGCGIGDDSLATKAELFYPHGVAVDTAGNVYIADEENNRIRKINTSGIITTIAGSGVPGFSGDGSPATDATLYYPASVAVDRAGNVYAADRVNNRVRMINTSGIISTFAGTSTAGYRGDGGPATLAELREPYGVAVDAAGDVYIADSHNNCIRKVDVTGIIATVAGDGFGGSYGDGVPATTAELNYPYAVACDNKGNFYIADWANSMIRRVDTAGIITTLTGNGTAGYGGDGGPATAAIINYPNGVTADTSGNIYFADAHNSRVRMIDTAGIIITIAGNGIPSYSGDGGPADSAEFCQPTGLTIDKLGNIYIPDDWNNRVRKFTVGGTVTTIAGQNGLFGERYNAVNAELSVPANVAVDNAGNIYVPDYYNNRIRVIDPASGDMINTVCGDGISSTYYGYSGDGGQADSARILNPTAVAVDAAGNLYVADQGNDRIRMVNPSGIITTIAGTGAAGYYGDGGPATAAELTNPAGVTIDTSGNVYIADQYNQRIRKINTMGIISTVAGNGMPGFSGDGVPATSTAINPDDVAIDLQGNIYIADGPNNRIRKVDPTGMITTVAGTGVAGFTGDGSLAVSAEINDPAGVKADGNGNIYFPDNGNNRVRMVDASGIIHTIAGNGTAGFSGDGGVATLAELSTPAGVAVDAAGNVYIADGYNYRIRKVNIAYLSAPAIGKSSSGEIAVFPNPARTLLNVNAQNLRMDPYGTINQITITNLLGQTICTQHYNSQTATIDVSTLPSGMYLIKINGSEVRKFVKE